MRPTILDPLFRPVSALKGVGAKLVKDFARLLDVEAGREPIVADLVFHLPSGVIDRRLSPGVARAPQGAIVTLTLRIDRHEPPRSGGYGPYRIFGQDATGEIALVYFRPRGEWPASLAPVGSTRVVSGKAEWFNGRPQMVHPDYVLAPEEAERMPAVEPLYPLTAGLGNRGVVRAVQTALASVPELPEWQEGPGGDLLAAWPSFRAALMAVHAADPAEVAAAARARLAYDELLASQLALGLVRERARRPSGRARVPDGSVTALLRAHLPFRPTASQEQAIAEIAEDLARPRRMLRLLQGDVGSGKTLVALFAAAMAAEAGGQTAVMAPTEVLARQHFASLAPLAGAAGLRLALLTGREKGAERGRVLAGLEAGEIDIVVGTHALFQTGVAFRDLALAVVDEQHRFGVEQRLGLTAKGEATDVLAMTATPIPRTLVLSLFGDMDVSKLTEKPVGRQPIATRLVGAERLEEMVERLGAAIGRGEKAYWICPLVEESAESDLTAAAERHADLAERLGPRVGLVHGRMKPAEKDAAMEAFRTGATRVLVATTVVEVGVDVPDATIIVVEHAERFGLAQLHQLRGRVGRGGAPSSCVLLYRGPLGETARARLEVMRTTDDGFVIAEKDLELRGEGELLGTRQSGTPGFRIADLAIHGDLVERARDDARRILAADPGLTGPRGEALRVLLYLFRRDAAVRLLRSG